MRVILVHNPSAGDGSPGADELCDLFRAAGHEPVSVPPKKKKLKRALEDGNDLVVVAGGDGTVEKVARRLAGASVTMAILPVGTSNNIAAALGISGSAADIIAGLDEAVPRRLDLGTARAPWGDKIFVESAGVGPFADMLRSAMRREAATGKAPGNGSGKRVRGQGLRKELRVAPAKRRKLQVDGEDRSGDYLMVVALSTRYIGPRIPLAPDADPGDGKLDVVVVREEDRGAVDDYLASLASDSEEAFPIPAFSARHICLEWDAESGHVDDKLWPGKSSEVSEDKSDAMVELSVVDPPLQVLVPRN